MVSPELTECIKPYGRSLRRSSNGVSMVKVSMVKAVDAQQAKDGCAERRNS